MRSRFLAAAITVVILATPAFASAAAPCPPEVKQAKDLLTAKTTSAKAKTPAKVQAAARGQDEQAARGQNPQAPRGQNEQAARAKDRPEHPEGPVPRGTTAKAGRGQDEQAARGQDEQAPRNVTKGRANAIANARRLVSEAETACKDADAQRALANAHAAMELLKYVP